MAQGTKVGRNEVLYNHGAQVMTQLTDSHSLWHTRCFYLKNTGSTSQSIATEQGDAGVGIPSVQIAGDGNGDVKIGFSQIPTLPLQD